MAFRLKPIHPLSKKMELLEKFLIDNKLEIEFSSYHTTLKDTETGVEVSIKDNDDASQVVMFPAQFEYKLIILDD